jgi:hypothetical protein
MRPKLLKDRELPHVAKSRTLSEDPTRLMPYRLKLEPSLRKLLKDIVLPNDRKSSTLRDDPSLLIP